MLQIRTLRHRKVAKCAQVHTASSKWQVGAKPGSLVLEFTFPAITLLSVLQSSEYGPYSVLVCEIPGPDLQEC